MANRKYLSSPVKQAMVNAYDGERTLEDIGKIFGVKKQTVHRVIKHYRITGSVHRSKKSGRPKVTTNREDKILVRLSKANPRLNAVDLNKDLKEN